MMPSLNHPRVLKIASCLALLVCLVIPPASAHVTLRANAPLVPGRYATILLVVPNERHLPTVQVSLEVPDAFLAAGGRLSRVQYPPGWQVEVVKEDKPSDVYEKEMQERSGSEMQRPAGAEHSSLVAVADPEESEETIMNEIRKKWIKRIIFSGGSIPLDAFQEFSLSFQLPGEPGVFRFAAVQTYSDGKEVSWSELVEGAEHPAPSIVISAPNRGRWVMPIAGIGVLVLLAFWAGTRMRRVKP